MKPGFLFDLDGVLIDSEKEYTRIWQEIDRHYPTGEDNFAIKIKGQTLPEILDTHFPKDLHPAVVDMLNEMEQKMHYEMLPGASELLHAIKQRELRCGLVTSSNEMKMQHLREELPGFESIFDIIVTADKITHSKPHPEGYLLAASTIGIPARKCIVFEDSVQGVRAGNASGAYTVGLTTTLPKESVEPFCNRVINDLSDIDIDEIIETVSSR